MQVKLNVRHTEIPVSMKEYINNKVGKFSRYFERIQEIHVVVEQIKFNFEVEIILKSDLFSVQAKEMGSDLRSTVDKVVHIIERKIKKEKDRIIKEKKHNRESLRRTDDLLSE